MRKAVIKTAIAGVMSKPDFYAEQTDEALHGMVVTFTEEPVNDFYKVTTSYRYTGYVHKSNLNFDEAAAERWQRTDKHIVNSCSADILREANVRGGNILTLTKGCFIITAGKDEDGYTKVATAQGTEGYIRTFFLSPPLPFFDLRSYDRRAETAFRENVVKTAYEYMETQYRWGGKTPLGIDCSGLCFMSYFLNGITIYRDASIKDGFPVRKIPRNRMKKGDLIFFPGHVALYIGNGKYIHSCEANDGVYVNSLNLQAVDFRKDQIVTCVGSAFW